MTSLTLSKKIILNLVIGVPVVTFMVAQRARVRHIVRTVRFHCNMLCLAQSQRTACCTTSEKMTPRGASNSYLEPTGISAK